MVSDTSSMRVVRMGNKRFLLWYNLNRTDTESFKDGMISVMAFGFRLAHDLARESGLTTKGSGV